MEGQHQKNFLGQCHWQYPRSWDLLADFPCAGHNACAAICPLQAFKTVW